MYFRRRKDFDILSAAAERIYPEDENGPGAIALGAPYFIDHQLAGGFGNNEREYTMGPFNAGTDYQGYQSPLKRHEVFMAGIRAMKRKVRKTTALPLLNWKESSRMKYCRNSRMIK